MPELDGERSEAGRVEGGEGEGARAAVRRTSVRPRSIVLFDAPRVEPPPRAVFFEPRHGQRLRPRPAVRRRPRLIDPEKGRKLRKTGHPHPFVPRL